MNTVLTEAKPCCSARAWKQQMARPRFSEMPYFSPMKHRSRILYVDGDPQVRTLGRLVLLRAGYEVDAAANGSAGWVALNETPYSLLIIDREMPRMAGLELAANARRSEMNIPIVMTAASFNPTETGTWASLEIAALLIKPYAVDSLLSTVAKLLRGDGLLQRQDESLPGQRSALPDLPQIRPYRHDGINE